MHLHRNERAQLTQSATRGSLIVAVILIALQFYAYFKTNSMVIMASVLESGVDVVISLATLFALHTSHRGPDHNHRWGHGKAESLVALGQAAFIGGSGIYFIVQSIHRLLKPAPIESANVGIIIMLISSMFIILLLIYQQHIVRRTHSLPIKTDFLHYMNDLAVNGVVIISLFICSIYPHYWVDSVASIAVALYILFAACRLGGAAAGELMDLELDDAARQTILKIIRNVPGVTGAHDLRTRRSGPDVFIEAHIEMPEEMKLVDVHHVTDELERALLAQFPTAHITLHPEPEGIADHRLDDVI